MEAFRLPEFVAEKLADAYLHGKTNADRIRAMTDEELAKWLNQMQNDAYNRGMLEDWIFGYPNNYDNWLDWLKEGTDHD